MNRAVDVIDIDHGIIREFNDVSKWRVLIRVATKTLTRQNTRGFPTPDTASRI